MASFPSKPGGIGSVSQPRTGWQPPSPPARGPAPRLPRCSQYDGLRKKAGGYGTPYLPKLEANKVKQKAQSAVWQLSFVHLQPQNRALGRCGGMGDFCNFCSLIPVYNAGNSHSKDLSGHLGPKCIQKLEYPSKPNG